jgi:hypothetical protein
MFRRRNARHGRRHRRRPLLHRKVRRSVSDVCARRWTMQQSPPTAKRHPWLHRHPPRRASGRVDARPCRTKSTTRPPRRIHRRALRPLRRTEAPAGSGRRPMRRRTTRHRRRDSHASARSGDRRRHDSRTQRIVQPSIQSTPGPAPHRRCLPPVRYRKRRRRFRGAGPLPPPSIRPRRARQRGRSRLCLAMPGRSRNHPPVRRDRAPGGLTQPKRHRIRPRLRDRRCPSRPPARQRMSRRQRHPRNAMIHRRAHRPAWPSRSGSQRHRRTSRRRAEPASVGTRLRTGLRSSHRSCAADARRCRRPRCHRTPLSSAHPQARASRDRRREDRRGRKGTVPGDRRRHLPPGAGGCRRR